MSRNMRSYISLLAVGIACTGCQLGNRHEPNWIGQPQATLRRTASATPALQAVKKLPAAAPTSQATVQTVAFQAEINGDAAGQEATPISNSLDTNRLENYSAATTGLPIDFPSVLRLAGADNWNVKIAQARVCEALANYNAAQVAWLPSLNLGMGYNHHEGEIQATDGTVQTVSRGSLFVGGGSKIGNNPLAGGSGGPSRMAVDLSLADAIFQPLATRQIVNAERFRESRVFNDVMLDASTAYFELVRAQAKLAVSQENQLQSQDVLKMTADFVEAGKGTLADQQRVQGIVNERRRDVVTAKAQIGIASAQLATVLQLDATKLDPDTGLVALDADVVPIDLVAADMRLPDLVAQAHATRQEIQEANWRAHSAQTQHEAEQWRPYLPNLMAGTSNGFFGGGTGGNLPKLDSRSDIDLQVVWEVRNLGAGVTAARDRRRSQLNQAIYISGQMKDQIANEVAAAYHDVQLQSESMVILQDSITQATHALRLNVEAIEGLEGLPLESVQSLNALAAARSDYLDAVVNYNLAQLRLLRAIGEPISRP